MLLLQGAPETSAQRAQKTLKHENPVAWAQRKRRRRAFVFSALGNVCRQCGATERLELDHVLGDGRLDRPDYHGAGTNNIRVAMRALHAGCLADRFQLLCHDCHVIKTRAERSARWYDQLA